MDFLKKHGFLIAYALLLGACTTMPQQDTETTSEASQVSTEPPKPFTEKPGEMTFGNPTADVMYEILIAEIATQRGDTDLASDFYLDAAKQSQNPEIAARAVRIANFAKNKENALEAAKIWVQTEPDNLEALRILAVLYLRENEIDKSKELLSTLLNSDKESLGRNILLTGAMLQRETSSESAEKIAEHLITLFPKQSEAYYIHASLAIQADMNETALESIKKCLALKPEWEDAIILYARILEENEQHEEALTYLKEYLKTNPKSNAVRLAYARALTNSRKLEEARGQFELLAIKMPNNEDVLFALAMLSMQFKDYDEAEGYLLQLDKLGKSNTQVIYYLGQIAEQKEDYSKAQQWYAQITKGEYYLDAQLRIAVILAKTENIESARTKLNSIKTKNSSEQRQINLFEGNLLRDFKHYQASFDFFSKLLETEKEDMDYLYFRSLVAERLNKIDVVISDLSFVIEKDPNNAAALNALGYTLADKTTKLEEALKLITRAKELEPNDPAIIDSLGWVNYKMGNTETALKYLKEAMDQLDDGEVSAHYGEVLWVSGDKEKAKEVWENAKEKFGDNEILIETLKRFNQ